MMMKNISELAKVVRSKNCSPFELTLDIIFKNRDCYETVKQKQLINKAKIAALYHIAEKDVLGLYFFDPANAVKAVIPRQVPSGSPGDTDVYGAQQHTPLLGLNVPVCNEVSRRKSCGADNSRS